MFLSTLNVKFMGLRDLATFLSLALLPAFVL